MQQKIDEDIKTALKQGDKATAEALRFLKSALINAKIAAGHELSTEEATKIIKKEMKLRVEARDMYAANGRSELASKEEFERTLYAAYVPDDLGQDKIIEIVNKIAHTIGSGCDFSQLMPLVMKEIAGRADGKTVADIVRNYLNDGGNK